MERVLQKMGKTMISSNMKKRTKSINETKEKEERNIQRWSRN
jgi:hypothetical protein